MRTQSIAILTTIATTCVLSYILGRIGNSYTDTLIPLCLFFIVFCYVIIDEKFLVQSKKRKTLKRIPRNTTKQ